VNEALTDPRTAGRAPRSQAPQNKRQDILGDDRHPPGEKTKDAVLELWGATAPMEERQKTTTGDGNVTKQLRETRGHRQGPNGNQERDRRTGGMADRRKTSGWRRKWANLAVVKLMTI
jgi:hypothetical protein